MQILVAILLLTIALILFWTWRTHKISNDTLNAFAAILTVIAGMAAILLFIVPAASPPPFSTNTSTPETEVTNPSPGTTAITPNPIINPVIPNEQPTTSVPPSDTPSPTPDVVPTNAFTDTPLPTPEYYEAGQWITLNDALYVRLNDGFYSMPDCRPMPQEFAVELQFHSDGGQYLLRYDPSSFHAVDDTGKVYKLLGVGNIFCNEIGIQNIQVRRGDTHLTLLFGGSFPLEAKYLIITADSINGLRLVFRKSL